MKIRPARVGDVPAIYELIRTFADRKLMIRRSLGELYESIREFIVAVDDENQIVGCAALHVFWEDLAELKCLAVSEEAQGRGVGRALLEALLAEAHRRGVRKTLLEVAVDNAPAQHLYATYDFEPIGIRRGYYQLSNTDALVMMRSA